MAVLAGQSAAATLRITTELPWLVRGWCRLLVRPLIRVDGVDHPLDWTAPVALSLAAGSHDAQFKARFRGTRDVGATSMPLWLSLEAGSTTTVVARIPAINGHPVTLAVDAAQHH